MFERFVDSMELHTKSLNLINTKQYVSVEEEDGNFLSSSFISNLENSRKLYEFSW